MAGYRSSGCPGSRSPLLPGPRARVAREQALAVARDQHDHRRRQPRICTEPAPRTRAHALARGWFGRAAAPAAERVVAIPRGAPERTPGDCEFLVGDRTEQLTQRDRLAAFGRSYAFVDQRREARRAVEVAEIQRRRRAERNRDARSAYDVEILGCDCEYETAVGRRRDARSKRHLTQLPRAVGTRVATHSAMEIEIISS